MKVILCTLFIIEIFQISKQQNDNERINEGASTSTQQLNQCEKCELHNYAERIVHLMTAEDIEGGDLTDMINNRFNELEAFHDEIFSYFLLAHYGANPFLDQARRNRRLEQFGFELNTITLKIIMKACSEHYRFKSWYEYDNNKNIILIREIFGTSSDGCLCGNDWERRILSTPLQFPEVNFPEVTHQITLNKDEGIITETSQYHIIPISLINKFFKVWLGELPTIPNLNYNGCEQTIYGRLKRSMQKLLIVKIIRESLVNNRNMIINNLTNADVNLFSEIFSHNKNWLSGNVFIGPRNRGPFDPIFERNEDESLEAFEYDVEPIIGKIRYLEFLSLYRELLEFVREPNSYPYSRLMCGLHLFFGMTLMFDQHNLTPMDASHWQEREPTSNELKKVKTKKLRREMRTQKYWAIKKHPRRSPRNSDYYTYTMFEEKESSVMKPIKYAWTKLIVDLMMVSTRTLEKKYPTWSCNFTLLFDKYLSNELNRNNDDCSNCETFDEFLYSKISLSDDWNRCNNGTITSKKWCQAWNRIKMDFYARIDSFGYSRLKFFRFSEHKKKSYLKDVETFISWISYTILSKNSFITEVSSKSAHQYQHHLERAESVIDISLCHMTTFLIAAVSWKNVCKNILRRVHRDLTTSHS